MLGCLVDMATESGLVLVESFPRSAGMGGQRVLGLSKDKWGGGGV